MMQIKEQTDKEKLDMYMKCSKEELAKMLISANNHIDNMRRLYVDETVSEEGIKWAREKIEEKYY